MTSQKERKERATRIVRYLRKAYPVPKSELRYATPFQFVVAVMLSAQCTDKLVNKVTEALFKKCKSPKDFARADAEGFAREISRVSFFRTKAELQKLPGIGYKTAHVVVGELFGHWPGIPTDTHVKRFARKFDLTTHTDLKKISHDLEALVPEKDWKYVNNGLVLYGRYICKANKHDCAQHPLTKLWPPAADRWPRAHELRSRFHLAR